MRNPSEFYGVGVRFFFSFTPYWERKRETLSENSFRETSNGEIERRVTEKETETREQERQQKQAFVESNFVESNIDNLGSGKIQAILGSNRVNA
jgi:hypothetical protein